MGLLKKLCEQLKNLPWKTLVELVCQTLLAILLVVIACCYKSTGVTDIAPLANADSVVMIDAQHCYITQSYQIPDRNITGLKIYVDPEQSTGLESYEVIAAMFATDPEMSNIIATSTAMVNPGADSYSFDFGNISVNPGTRYYLSVGLMDRENSTVKLAIKTFYDYAGLKLAGDEIPGAVCGSISYRYAGNIAGILKLILVFSSIAILYMLIFNRQFGACIALSFGTVFLYLFVFGVLGILNAGVGSLYVISMIITILLPLIATLRGRSWYDIITPGFIGFWAIVAIYFIWDRNLVVGKADDLNHWQLAVRDMWFSDSYAYHVGNAYITPRYTPGFATIEYFFARMYGTYREGILLLAAHTTGAAFMGVMLDRLSWKNALRVPFIVLLIISLPLYTSVQYSGILYVDAYLGIVGAYLFMCYFTEEHSIFNLIRITIGSILLVMTKEFGLVIAFTFYVAVIIDLVVKNLAEKDNNKKKAGWMTRFISMIETKCYFVSGVIAVGSYVVWLVYCKLGAARLVRLNTERMAAMAGFGKEQTVAVIDNVGVSATQNLEMVQAAKASADIPTYTAMDSIKGLWNWFFQKGMYLEKSFIQILVAILFIAVIIILSKKLEKKEDELSELNIRFKTLTATVYLGIVVYVGALLLAFIFLFAEDSATPAEERYIGSYLLLMIISIVGTLLIGLNGMERNRIKAGIVVIGVGIMSYIIMPMYTNYYTTPENFGAYYTDWDNYRTIMNPVRTFADREETVFFIGYEENPHYRFENYLTMHNAIVPTLSQGFEDWRPVVDSSLDYGMATVNYSADDLVYVLSHYNYMYLRDYDDNFLDGYNSIFEDESEIVEGGFYKLVETKDNEYKLHRIAIKNLN